MQTSPKATLVYLLLAGVLAHAQARPATSVPQTDLPEPAQVLTGNLGNEPVGTGDLVYVTVTGAPELTRSYRVADDGRLTLPLVPNPIPVVGLAPPAVAQAVREALMHANILVSPIVSVSVLEYRSRQVSVVGAVKTPVVVQAVGDMKLLDAIARAQGFTPEAGPEVIVSRPGKTPGTTDTTRISIKDLLAGNNSALNVPLRGGEEVRVPDAPKLFIMGNVKMPGSYPLNELGGTTVLKALAMSQGALPYSTKQAYVYRLESGSSERKEIAIPIREILRRKAPDVQLQANDILYIPENTAAHLNAKIIDRITGIGGSGLMLIH